MGVSNPETHESYPFFRVERLNLVNIGQLPRPFSLFSFTAIALDLAKIRKLHLLSHFLEETPPCLLCSTRT